MQEPHLYKAPFLFVFPGSIWPVTAATGLLKVYYYQHSFSFGFKRRDNYEAETATCSHISGKLQTFNK